MKTDKGIYYSALNSKLQRELVADMEMMSHLGNSKYREPCTETKFQKKKEKKRFCIWGKTVAICWPSDYKRKDGQEMLDNFLE